MKPFVLLFNFIIIYKFLCLAHAIVSPALTVTTWNFQEANIAAWNKLLADKSAIDAIEAGCSYCEQAQCDGTVGWGGSPAEDGETTLDAMIMDGETYDVGGVAGLRRIKSAISVARLVMEKTKHSLLVGDMATEFAKRFGFKEESLISEKSSDIQRRWLKNNCQPNFWKNVVPDPTKYCIPYHPGLIEQSSNMNRTTNKVTVDDVGHDTIGMLAMDSRGRIASGTSTNGLSHKIPGRVGDSPIAGAGSYAAGGIGAAAATGDGDVIMRFLLSYQAVENLRQKMKPDEAALNAILRQKSKTKPGEGRAGLIVISRDGTYGAACMGYDTFPFIVSNFESVGLKKIVKCI